MRPWLQGGRQGSEAVKACEGGGGGGPPPPYGVLWVARYDGQARKLSKTKSSSVVFTAAKQTTQIRSRPSMHMTYLTPPPPVVLSF